MCSVSAIGIGAHASLRGTPDKPAGTYEAAAPIAEFQMLELANGWTNGSREPPGPDVDVGLGRGVTVGVGLCWGVVV
jgi:hypothetical protein